MKVKDLAKEMRETERKELSELNHPNAVGVLVQ
jgi:hypothetical protein